MPTGARKRRGNDHATAAILGFVVGAAVLAFVFAMLASQQQSVAGAEKEGPLLRSRAERTLDVLVETPGADLLGGAAWELSPEDLGRLGLATERAPQLLDPAKLRKLAHGPTPASVNGLVDYEEAKQSLGLAGLQFHLRTQQLSGRLGEIEKPVRIPVAYIGDHVQHGRGPVVEQEHSKVERGLLGFLVEGWTNATHTEGGDVYPDLKDVLNNDLPPNLTRYAALVVGSEVDQTAMSSAAAKLAVRDWVYAGGHLVVLGSGPGPVTWLQPLFHADLEDSSEPTSVPDETHPVLTWPEELQHGRYEDNERTFSFNTPAHADLFTQVMARGSGTDAVLAVSKPGAFEDGSIILTSWNPYDLSDPPLPLEAEKLLFNFLTGAGGLTVAFGPPVPRFQEVAGAVRIAAAPLPGVPDERALLRVTLHVFR